MFFDSRCSNCLLSLEHCSIEVQAYSGNEHETPAHGFVKLNAVPVWRGAWLGTYPNLRGVSIILVDPSRCSIQESRHFDTYLESNAATELSSYLQQVGRCYIIVGVSGDEPRGQLHDALSTLREIGVDVVDVEHRGSFAFVAQSGYPTKTVLRKVLSHNESYTNPAHCNVAVTGAIVHLHCFKQRLPLLVCAITCVILN